MLGSQGLGAGLRGGAVSVLTTIPQAEKALIEAAQKEEKEKPASRVPTKEEQTVQEIVGLKKRNLRQGTRSATADELVDEYKKAVQETAGLKKRSLNPFSTSTMADEMNNADDEGWIPKRCAIRPGPFDPAAAKPAFPAFFSPAGTMSGFAGNPFAAGFPMPTAAYGEPFGQVPAAEPVSGPTLNANPSDFTPNACMNIEAEVADLVKLGLIDAEDIAQQRDVFENFDAMNQQREEVPAKARANTLADEQEAKDYEKALKLSQNGYFDFDLSEEWPDVDGEGPQLKRAKTRTDDESGKNENGIKDESLEISTYSADTGDYEKKETETFSDDNGNRTRAETTVIKLGRMLRPRDPDMLKMIADQSSNSGSGSVRRRPDNEKRLEALLEATKKAAREKMA